jgi:hypothetical protein
MLKHIGDGFNFKAGVCFLRRFPYYGFKQRPPLCGAVPGVRYKPFLLKVNGKGRRENAHAHYRSGIAAADPFPAAFKPILHVRIFSGNMGRTVQNALINHKNSLINYLYKFSPNIAQLTDDRIIRIYILYEYADTTIK